jgi:uncharacterized protein (DUF58 family)
MPPPTGRRYKFFDPRTVARLKNLSMVAKGIVEGFLTGLHRSPFHGFSVEFSGHREYAPGDDLKFLDWKVYGRTDRYYIKQFVQETNVRTHILLDMSASMNFGSSGVTKLEYASYLAAALTQLLVSQQDAVGLVTFDNRVQKYIPPKSTPSHVRRILHALEEIEPSQDTSVAPVLHHIAETIHRSGLIILITDLYDDFDQIISGLEHLRHYYHSLIVMHVMDENELTFPYESVAEFVDLEDRSRVQVNPLLVRERYLELLQAFLDKCRKDLLQHDMEYLLMNTATPYDKVLARYLAARRKMS